MNVARTVAAALLATLCDTGLAQPPLPLAPAPEAPVSTRLQVFVREIRLTGNTVFSDQELRRLTAPYENRVITSEELQELRQRLTLYYVERGYLNSGAVIPDQEVADGVVRLDVVEGRLTGIEIAGNERLRAGWLRPRLALPPATPLNLGRLQERLQRLQQDPLVERIDAELGPGLRPGEAVLRVRIEEARPYRLGLRVANDRSPAVGGERLRLYAAHRNLSGWGDSLEGWFGTTGDANDVELSYALPLTARDTRLGLRYQNSDSEVIEAPFDELEIESELQTFGVVLSHPVYRTLNRTLTLGLGLERRHSKTFLLGMPESFSPGVPAAGADEGESDVTVVRFFQDWLDRRQDQVIAARSTLSLGIDALGATRNAGGLPDGRFVGWLGQMQWARRFGERGTQLILRTDLQLASRSLLPLEQIALGGANTVRGYRESLLVRDNGLIASLELRVPVFRLPIPGVSRGPDDGWVQLAPFADYGRGWNTDLETPEPDDIASVGLGLRWAPAPAIHGELYWGHALREVDLAGSDIQDSGIHFKVEVFYP